MYSPGDRRGEDVDRHLMTKVVRRSGEEASKSFLAALYMSIKFQTLPVHLSNSLPGYPHKVFGLSSRQCAAVLLSITRQKKVDVVNRTDLPPLFPRYNIAPSQSVLAIVSARR